MAFAVSSRPGVRAREEAALSLSPALAAEAPYFAHHLEAGVQDLLGQLVVHSVRPVVCHRVVTHQLEICLKRKETIHQVWNTTQMTKDSRFLSKEAEGRR